MINEYLWLKTKIANHLTAEEKIHFQKYHETVETWRKSQYMRYPQQVHIETQAVCNASCVFCPYSRMERSGVRMPDDLIIKIIDDLREIPTDIKFNICPFKISDPFLDSRLFSIIERVEETLPNANVWLATNGSALTYNNIQKLALAKRKLDLAISLNYHRPKEYEAAMGLSFDRTIANLKILYREMTEGRFAHRVVIGRVSEKQEDDLDFIRWVKLEFPEFLVQIKPAGNWLGEISSRTHSSVLPIGCLAWFQISITATGDVALCCMDAMGVVNLGNVRNKSVLDIYNSSAHLGYRMLSATRNDIYPCGKCTYPETCGISI